MNIAQSSGRVWGALGLAVGSDEVSAGDFRALGILGIPGILRLAADQHHEGYGQDKDETPSH